jgi:methionine-rich copper-binding protein CopC
MRRRGRLAALALPLAGLWLLATGPAAAAHGVLESSEPAGGSSLERAPAAVTLRFSERPDPGLSTVRVLDSGGRAVAGGPARPVAGRPLELRVPLAGLPAGGYTVTWRIVSAVDGHRTDGVFGFGVGAAGAPQLAASQAVTESAGPGTGGSPSWSARPPPASWSSAAASPAARPSCWARPWPPRPPAWSR